MPNLLDIVPVLAPEKSTGKHPEVVRSQELKSGLEGALKFARSLELESDKGGRIEDSLVRAVNARLAEIRTEVFRKTQGQLPKELREITIHSLAYRWLDDGSSPQVLDTRTRRDDHTRIAESPRVLLQELRSIADRLCMVLMPLDYLIPAAFRGYSSAASSVDRFKRALLSADFQPYVMAPIQYYSVSQHVKATNPDLPVYAGQHSMVFMSVAMNIPMFRTILNDIEDLKSKMVRIETAVGNVQRNIASMQLQIDNLAKEVARQRQAVIVAERRAAAAEAAAVESVRTLEAMRFIAEDPLAIGLPAGALPTDNDVPAVLGPCWGPDFADILAELNGLQVVAGQRGRLTKLIDGLY